MHPIGNAAAGLSLAALAALLWLWQPAFDWRMPGTGRIVVAGAACLLWGLLCVWARRGAAHKTQTTDASAVAVVYASQTGSAERLANQTVSSLGAGGIDARLLHLQGLDPAALAQTASGAVLFVVSTTGEGDPPDDARAFVEVLQRVPAAVRDLRYGLLSLGDRRYAQYCGFGRELEVLLRAGGAMPLFETVEVDNGDAAAIERWHDALNILGSERVLPPLLSEPFLAMRLEARHPLNPGSPGGPVFHLRLAPESAALPNWQAGDIAEIRLPGAAGLIREYSLASIPPNRHLELLVRQQRHADGYGAGSAWLTLDCALGGRVDVRVRRNSAFHAPPGPRPMILIGNGTGIAGLRAHLKARAAAKLGGAWLIFGERQLRHDFHFRDEIAHWQQSAVIERLDLAFSRDTAQRVYVQQRIVEAGAAVDDFVKRGAAIYVCGSLEGMAPGVDAALRDVLGGPLLDGLAADGRYRRDVY